MAAVALHDRVAVQQGEIGPVVVERVAIETDDVGISAFMLGVAGGAFDLGDSGRTPVKAHHCLNVVTNLGMTAQTELALLFSRERLMTVRALVLVLGMPLDDGARHKHALEYLGACFPRQPDTGESRAHDEPTCELLSEQHAIKSTNQYMCTARICTRVATTRM